MIERNKYLNQLINVKENGFPKVITGIRRCGKSYLLNEIFRQYLLSEGVKPDHIIVIELDDDRNVGYRDPLMLGDHVRSLCRGNGPFFVMLDEIQKVYSIVNPNLTDGKHVKAKSGDEEIVSFVDVVLGLSREKNIDLYVTGSNSKI